MQFKVDKSNWKKVRLGDVATEYSKRCNNPSESGFERFIGSSNINQWDFRINSWESTDSVTSAMKLFEPNDYLLVRRSLYASDFRERAPRANFAGVCSGDILTIRENPKMIADGFLIGILNSPALWKYVVANASGSITRRIKWRDLANYEFLLPPKEQQAELAELLWAMDEVIEKELALGNRSKFIYETERETSCFGTSNDSHNIYNKQLKSTISDTYKFRKLGEFLHAVKYGTSQKGNADKKGVKVIGIPNVLNEKLTIDNCNYSELSEREASTCKLEKGDIVIVRTNGNPEYTGRSALFDLDEEVAYASYLIKISIDRSFFEPEFLVRYLQTKTIRKFFRRNATSTAGNYNINTEVIKSVPVPEIPLDIQKDIVRKLRLIENCNEGIESIIYASKALQKSLINEIF